MNLETESGLRESAVVMVLGAVVGAAVALWLLAYISPETFVWLWLGLQWY